MSLTIKVKRQKGGAIERLTKHLQQLKNKTVEVGYLSGGQHPTAEMSYARLMYIHETGQLGNPERPVLGITARELLYQRNPVFFKHVKRVVGEVGRLDVNLKTLGEFTKDYAQSIFGSGKLIITRNPTPLIDTESLRNAMEYKITNEGRK